MARPITVSKTLTAASANCVALSQTLGGAGSVTINGALASGGVATLTTQRRIIVTSAGNDTGITFKITGTTDAGAIITETITGANAGASATQQDFATVSSVYASGATASTITVGTNTTGSTPWQMPNFHITPFDMSFVLKGANLANSQIEFTLDTVMQPIPIYSNTFTPPNPIILPTDNNNAAYVSSPIQGWRLTTTSGTTTTTLTALQTGIRN